MAVLRSFDGCNFSVPRFSSFCESPDYRCRPFLATQPHNFAPQVRTGSYSGRTRPNTPFSGAPRTTAGARTRRSAGGDLPGSNAPQLLPSRRDSRKPNSGRWLMLRHRLNLPPTGGTARYRCMLGWMCLPLARCQKVDTGPGQCQCFSTCGAGTTSGLPFSTMYVANSAPFVVPGL